MQFTDEGAAKFTRVTRNLAKRGRERFDLAGSPRGQEDLYAQEFAIVFDREVMSVPTVSFLDNPGGIPGEGGAEISGIGSLLEAKELALVLQTGALPPDFRVVSKETRQRPG
jgi:preprotein translocase subunit SecD